MSRVTADEWRVEVDLDDEAHGISLGERIRSLELDDGVREKLGGGVVVTRDGPRFFLYAETEAGVRAAERVVRDLVEEHGLTADIKVTRWHPVEEAWEDASVPLPRTDAEVEAERARLEAAEEREAAEEGSYDWRVRVALPHRHDAVQLEGELLAEGLDTRRRWRYVTIGVPTKERGDEVAAAVLERAPEGTEAWVEVDPEDLPRTPFDFIPPLG
jgi:hypothetical protein